MARRDALLRLRKTLLGRRSDLLKKLADDLHDLHGQMGAGSTGDEADAAFEAGSDEMASQLAELDARELTQIERALTRIKQGTYGHCEVCQKKIPVGRLNALPYTTMCIECQREMEHSPDWGAAEGGNWDKVNDASSYDEPRVDLSQLELDSGR